MVDDGLFGIGGQGPNFFDADPQARHVALGAGFRQESPGSQRGTDPGKVFEAFRSYGGIHMHDRQFGPVNQGELESMGEGHVTVMREICGMKNALKWAETRALRSYRYEFPVRCRYQVSVHADEPAVSALCRTTVHELVD